MSVLAKHGLRPALVTAVCFLSAILAWGTVLYSHSVYMDAMMRLHGWSTSLISSAIFVFWIASLPGLLNCGVMVDRHGPAPVFATGGVFIGASLLALGWLDQPWQLYLAYAAMGFGYPAVTAAAISATLNGWYERSFGFALGIALTGASIGGAILPLAIVKSSGIYGFPVTMTAMGVAVIVTIWLCALALMMAGCGPGTTANHVADAAFSMRDVLRRPLFWRVALATALGLGGQVGFLSHQVPFIAETSDRVFAAYMVTLVAVMGAVGRVIVGYLSQHVASARLAALAYMFHGAGIAMLIFAGAEQSIIAGCFVAGLAVGAIVTLPPILTREAFGSVGYGRTFALVNIVMYMFAAVAPWIVGLLRDYAGGYDIGLWVPVTMEVAAAALVFGAMPKKTGRG